MNRRVPPDPGSVETIVAAVEVILPPSEDHPGDASVDAGRRVVDLIDRAVAGYADLVAALLDAYARDVPPHEAPFASLDPDDRSRVLRAMASDESQDVAEVVSILLLFTFGAGYSEWPGFDRRTGSLQRPSAWDRVGYLGPSLGHPAYREGS